MPTARITVHVQPRASRPGLVAVDEDRTVRLRLAAPPVEGRANEEAIATIAELVGVPKSAVRVVGGGKSRRKTLEIEGLETEAVLDALRRNVPG